MYKPAYADAYATTAGRNRPAMHHRGLDVEQHEVGQHVVQAPRSAADGRGSQHRTDVLQVGAEMSGGEKGDGADRRRTADQ